MRIKLKLPEIHVLHLGNKKRLLFSEKNEERLKQFFSDARKTHFEENRPKTMCVSSENYCNFRIISVFSP